MAQLGPVVISEVTNIDGVFFEVMRCPSVAGKNASAVAAAKRHADEEAAIGGGHINRACRSVSCALAIELELTRVEFEIFA
ncbi:hypothetical protein PTKU15_87720 [Paraburkholderia terrae]|nr:hypothetical protein PTKU15_87720 [Paraburkholderia terrae]